MDYPIQEIARQIKAARKRKGFSQKALGNRVGMPQSHISKIEKGLVDLQTSSLIQIARALGLEPVLVAREHLTTVEALQHPPTSKQIPAYRLSEEEDDEDT